MAQDEAKRLKYSTLMKWIKDGAAEAMQDLKPDKHVEIRYVPSGKRETVYVVSD